MVLRTTTNWYGQLRECYVTMSIKMMLTRVEVVLVSVVGEEKQVYKMTIIVKMVMFQ